MLRDRNKSGPSRTSDALNRAGLLFVSLVLLAVSIGAPSASADEAPIETPFAVAPEPGATAHSSAAVEPMLTDPEMAKELPHHDLGRAEADELLEGVFSRGS